MAAIMSEGATPTSTTSTAADDSLSRVDGLVQRLASEFEAGLDFYNTWLQNQQTKNTYHRSRPAATSLRPIKCAVSTSLDMSSYRIQSTYQIAFTLIGPDFAAGDDQTLTTLTTALSLLHSKINHLCQTITFSLQHPTQQPLPLPLHEIYLCSEQVRINSVSALAQQYRRMASQHPSLPQTLPVPRPKRMSALLDELDEADLRFSSSETSRQRSSLTSLGDSENTMERIVTAESEVPVLISRSNPPSPPLTPKVLRARSEGFSDVEGPLRGDAGDVRIGGWG
ncbi:hypothetical protein B0T21DRAFT_426552 [Apiosordaria backusii]|uniref:Uncharacterized protein n=1 Tax=Apiosordaria backusii TaxID=314023 RepID=A0AA40AEK7_9PEZI|nr:hypothetical protein B0T21DRAFT_426552 [Apiosordaria backusii]